MRTVLRPILVLVVVGTLCNSGSVEASVVRGTSMRLGPASHVVLAASFRAIGVAPAGFLASGDYVLFSTAASYGSNPAWIVVNDRRGTTTALSPRCNALGLGPPWVLMTCPTANPSGADDVELYSLTDGTRQTVTPGPGLPPPCPQPDVETECAGAAAVGAYWIRWDASCYNCAVTSYFQNIKTGELRGDPTAATTFADLNSPTLAHRTCPGVRLMAQPDYPRPWGSLTYQGPFALVASLNRVYLERCGTGMRRPLGSGAWTSNTGAIVWQPRTTQLDGLFLPSLQSFMIPLPAVIVKPPGSPEAIPVSGLALTTRALYVRDGWAGTVWRTASPTALPLNTTRPSLTRSTNGLTCRRGRWRNADRFSYKWWVNGTAQKAARSTLPLGNARGRRSVSCSVTASNASGTATAASAPLPVR